MPLFEALGLKHLGDVGEEKELEEDGDLESLTFSARSSAGDDSGDDELESLAAFSEHPDAELDGDEDIDSEGDAELPRDAVDGADGDTVPEAEAARDPADEGEPELWAKAAGDVARLEYSREDAARFVRALGGEDRLHDLLSQFTEEDEACGEQADVRDTAVGVDAGADAPVAVPSFTRLPSVARLAEEARHLRNAKALESEVSWSLGPATSPALGGKRRRKGKARSKAEEKRVHVTTVTLHGNKSDDVRTTSFVTDRDLNSPTAETASAVKQLGGALTGDIGEQVAQLGAMLDNRKKGMSAADVFGVWVEEMLTDISIVPQLVEWLESTAGTRFLLKRLGKIKEVKKVKKNVKDVADRLGMPLDMMSEAVDSLKKDATSHSPKISSLSALLTWDDKHRTPLDKEQPLDFIYPAAASEKQKFSAQLQAKVMLKAGKFVISCEPKKVMDVRELRFKVTVLGTRRVMEARYLGSTEKFVNIEPWVMFDDDAEEVLFFGWNGKEAKDPQDEFLGPLGKLNNSKLPGGTAFAVDLFEGEPVLMLYDAANNAKEGRTLYESCIGATNVRALRDFAEELKMGARPGTIPSLAEGLLPDGFLPGGISPDLIASLLG